jgi:hypothetical protein
MDIDGRPARGEVWLRYAGGYGGEPGTFIPKSLDVETSCTFANYTLNSVGDRVIKSYKGEFDEFQQELIAVRQLIGDGAILKFDAATYGHTHLLKITSATGHISTFWRPDPLP